MRTKKKTGSPPRRQCRTCPWRADVDPRDIGEGYGHVDPTMLALMTAEGHRSLVHPSGVATCHAAADDARLPCVGWLAHQLGPGGNLGVRLRVIRGQIDANIETVGPQRDLPRELLGGGE